MATPVVVLDRGNNTTCTINLHGCTIVSWRVNNQVKTRLDHPDLSFFGPEICDPVNPDNMTFKLIVTKSLSKSPNHHFLIQSLAKYLKAIFRLLLFKSEQFISMLTCIKNFEIDNICDHYLNIKNRTHLHTRNL